MTVVESRLDGKRVENGAMRVRHLLLLDEHGMTLPIKIRRERIVESNRNLCGEVYNIGPDDNEISILELAKKIGHHCAKYPHFEHFPDRPAEVKNAWCSSEKIKSEFNYNTTRTLDSTLQEMCAWIDRRGPEEFNYALDLEFVTEATPRTWVERLI